jgi:hypothetical protein
MDEEEIRDFKKLKRFLGGQQMTLQCSGTFRNTMGTMHPHSTECDWFRIWILRETRSECQTEESDPFLFPCRHSSTSLRVIM